MLGTRGVLNAPVLVMCSCSLFIVSYYSMNEEVSFFIVSFRLVLVAV
jgi:hypothetical protein